MKETLNKKQKSPGKSKKGANSLFSNLDFRISLKSKRLKQEQLKYDKLIEELSTDISKKLSYGFDETNIKIPKEYNLQDIVKYILKKENRNKNDVLIIRYFLFQYPALLDSLNLGSRYYETKEILNKIAIHLKKEEIQKNNVVFYNGQIGKTFYIILEGEVSVLLPTEYSANITMDKYLEYLDFLKELKDYDLLRLSYESNKNLLDKYDYEMDKKLKYFDYCLDKVIPNNHKKEEVTPEIYMNKYLFKDKENDKNEIDNINNIKAIEIKNINESNIKQNKEDNQDNSFNDYSSLYENDNNNSDNSKISNYSIDQKNIQSSLEIKKILPKKVKTHNFSLWKYIEITKLRKGQCFGEIALQSPKNRRTATIIALGDCLFGILEKDKYLLFVKETMEKIRRNNIERLLNTKLFIGINFATFESRYFNCFTFSKEKKGAYLFKRGEKRNNLIYIKKGEIQLEIFTTCKQLDNIILSIGGNPYDYYLNNIMRTNKKINEFINIPKKFNISIFSQGDIIGTDELVYIGTNEFNLDKFNYKDYIFSTNINTKKVDENCFIFNGIYLTNSEVFKLDINFLESMLKDKTIKNNYKKLLKDKKERLIERLINIKSNIILQYYNLISESKNNFNIKNLNERKSYSFLFNKKININNKQFFSLKNINSHDFQNNTNKINTAINTRNSSFFDEISKKRGKTKDFFYQEQNIHKRNENNDNQKRSLLTSFMNNNNYKGKITKKVFLSGNNTLHKFYSKKSMEFNKNKTYYNYNNNALKKISLSKNNINSRNTITNWSNINTAQGNESNLSKNNSSDKMSTFKSFYHPQKKQKKLKLSDELFNSFKNPELKLFNKQKIPKLLMNNVIIYNTIIDKILLRPKKNIFKNPILLTNKDNNTFDIKDHENNKINTLDALAFDDIINNIKNSKFLNNKNFLPIANIKKKKRMNNIFLPKTAYNFFLKKNKNF